ncbi:MAG: hypothetical protein FJX78_01710 [Armatimonadetes bacterium]|nr:hypothetical protein [Armatimonadota bacterium]
MTDDRRTPESEMAGSSALGRLFAAHAELAGMEARRAASEVARSAALFVAALALLGGALFLLPALLVLVLANWMPAWVAALLVVVVVLVGAALVAWIGWRQLRRPKLAAIRLALKEDRSWIVDLMHSLRRSDR